MTVTGIRDSHWGEQALRLNGAGQVTAERREQGRQKQARLFGYDSEQNLCEVSAIAPDGAGRLSAKNATVQLSAGYDAAGRVTQRGGHQYQYDSAAVISISTMRAVQWVYEPVSGRRKRGLSGTRRTVWCG
ncbi:hypothetical protein [Dickeya fangzhongdai]